LIESARALGLCRILDDGHSGRGRQRSELLDRSHLAEQVDRHDRLGPLVECRPHGLGVNQKVSGVDINQDRYGADPADGLGGGDKGIGGEYDLASGGDAGAAERELKRVGAVTNADAIADVGEFGVGEFELGHRLAADEGSTGKDFGQSGLDLGGYFGMLGR
jgi:hypothetical protein